MTHDLGFVRGAASEARDRWVCLLGFQDRFKLKDDTCQSASKVRLRAMHVSWLLGHDHALPVRDGARNYLEQGMRRRRVRPLPCPARTITPMQLEQQVPPFVLDLPSGDLQPAAPHPHRSIQ